MSKDLKDLSIPIEVLDKEGVDQTMKVILQSNPQLAKHPKRMKELVAFLEKLKFGDENQKGIEDGMIVKEQEEGSGSNWCIYVMFALFLGFLLMSTMQGDTFRLYKAFMHGQSE